MFERTSERRRLETTRRLGSFVLSLLAHTTLLLVLIVLPLVFFDALPDWELLTFLIAAPAPPPEPPPVPMPIARRVPIAGSVRQVAFVAPDRIPDSIPAPEEDAVLPSIFAGLDEVRGALTAPESSKNLARLIDTLAPPPVVLPPRPEKRHEPVAVGGRVQASKLLSRVEPSYPELAKRARVSGIVVLEVAVDEEGSVYEVKVLQGHPLLVDAAVTAVRQWRYSPTLLNGEPVPVIATVTVVFNLK
jgi:periplasmic protein TonB